MALSYGAKFMTLMFGLLGVSVAVNVTNFVLASRTNDGLVDREYYRHGLHYDPKKEYRANPMGWRVGLTAKPDAAGRVAVIVSLADRQGAPLKGASATVTLFRPTRDGMDEAIALHELAPGRLEGTGKLPATGIWDATVAIQRGEERYHYRERLKLAGNPS